MQVDLCAYTKREESQLDARARYHVPLSGPYPGATLDVDLKECVVHLLNEPKRQREQTSMFHSTF